MEGTELVVIENSIFAEGKLDVVLGQLRDKAEAFIEVETDLTTDKGRKLIATNARKFSSSKAAIELIGVGLVSERKAELKLIDNERKRSKDFCDNLRDSVRAPLTVWENKEREKGQRLAELAKLSNDWDEAIRENSLFDREKEIKKKEAIHAKEEKEKKEKEEKERRAKEQKEREKRIADEAAKTAKEGEDRAKREKEQAIKDAEAKRVKDVKEAEEKVKKEAQDKEDKRLAEEKRIIDEGLAREKNKTHRAFINNGILDTFTSHGVKKDAGKKIIGLIATGKVPNLKILY